MSGFNDLCGKDGSEDPLLCIEGLLKRAEYKSYFVGVTSKSFISRIHEVCMFSVYNWFFIFIFNFFLIIYLGNNNNGDCYTEKSKVGFLSN